MQTNKEISKWIHSINPLITRLEADVHNHRISADPWKRKAQSMVKSWTMQFKNARPPKQPKTPIKLAGWYAASVAMTYSLNRRAVLQRERTGWMLWAVDRAQQDQRCPARFRQS